MRIGKTVLGAAAAAVLCVGFAFAQDGQTDVAQSGAAPQAQAPTFDESLLDVPEGKDLGFYKERMQQIQTGVRAFAQSNPSEEDLARVKEKIVDAFLVIFPALIADEELDEERRSGMVVHYAAFLSHKGELDKLQACIDSETAKEEPDARLVANLKSFLVIPKIRQAGQAKDSAGLQAAVDEYIDIVMTADSTVGSAKAVVDAVKEYDAELAKSALTKMIAAFKTSDGGLRKRLAEVLEEEQRFNNLVGNDMLVEGLYLDGSEIKWDEYRGKVVLIDFFATWRRPCMQEIPNVKALYDKYHDAGFEVLSYSVDT
ncbi:MAG: TlpA family protein disulfide reductase, partial [Thermoguttaceae bacterium]|nr:TlpA family protein disulfide reductase [Thermoguttaceae bacterium]